MDKELEDRFDMLEEILYNKFDELCNEIQKISPRKDNTPVWYDITKVDIPPTGEVWIKDINGVETLAKCKGRALIYPASSDLHEPEFWKPV